MTDEPALFCVVANVAAETAHGEGGLEIRGGVRHFTPGAKVWVLPPQWGDGGAQVIVVGYHRGTRGRQLARMVVPRRHLAGFRVSGVYSPAVARELTRPLTELGWNRPPGTWRSREEAERAAAHWSERPVEARADGPHSFQMMVADPPPLELVHRGRTYYLAQFNAHRAWYADAEPPAEPPRG
jgi:hypothetical protein